VTLFEFDGGHSPWAVVRRCLRYPTFSCFYHVMLC